MSEWFIYSLILIMSVSFSDLSFSYSKVSRVFYAYGKSVAEVSADIIGKRLYVNPPTFDKEKLEKKTEEYFTVNLGKKGEGYDYVLTYATSKDIREFTLSFEGKVSSYFLFKKSATFLIKEGQGKSDGN